MGKFSDDALSSEPAEDTTGIPRITVTPESAPPRRSFVDDALSAPFPGPRGAMPTTSGGFPGPTGAPTPTDWTQLNRPFGELKPSDVTPTQRLKYGVMDALGFAPNYSAQHLGNALVDIANVTPMGTLLSLADLSHDMPRGNFGASALDALGALPLWKAGRTLSRGGDMVRTAETPTQRIGDYAFGDARNVPLESGRVAGLFPEGGGAQARRASEQGAAQAAATGGTDIFGRPISPPLPRRMPESLEEAKNVAYNFTQQSPIVYHSDAMTDATRQMRMYAESPHHGRGIFSDVSAPGAYAELAWFDRHFPPGGMRPVTPSDFDQLRQRLQALSGADGVAGRQMINALERYMINPPPGALRRGSPQDLLDLENAFVHARGNYRALKTSEGVSDAADYGIQAAAGEHSGRNAGNRIRQKVNQFVTSDAGQEKLFGATRDELGQIANAAAGDRATNFQRTWSNRLGGGAGIGQTGVGAIGAGAATTAAQMLGADAGTTLALAGAGAILPGWLGGKLRAGANAGTEAAVREVANNIARNSPLYRFREARSPDVADPRSFARDAMALALMPQLREPGTRSWNEDFVPIENR